MDAEYSKGQRLFVETNVGNLEGVFYSMDPGHNRLTLTGVVLQPSGEKMEGFSHYYKNEVISVYKLDEDRCAGVSIESEAVVEENWIHKDQQAVQPGRITESDVMDTMSRDTAMNCSEQQEEEFDVESMRIDSYVLIENVGVEFRKAVEDIQAEQAVCVNFEGAMFGRHSYGSLLCFATTQCVFLFDIYTLGDAAFDNGLRDILQSEEIWKIMHNCRAVSDCLFHRYGVEIRGVYDTQVVDMMVTQLRYGQYPRGVRSLPECLSTYLNVPAHLIYHPEGNAMLESAPWNIRPLSSTRMESAVKNTVFLLPLWKKVKWEIPRIFDRNVGVFLAALRDSDFTEARNYLAESAKVPLELLAMMRDER